MKAAGGVMKAVAGIAIAGALLTAVLLACGPYPTILVPVTSLAPADAAGYSRGELGVVRPRFARRYLVQAYRVLTGRKPLPTARIEPAVSQGQTDTGNDWLAQRDGVLGAPPAGVERR